MPDTTTFGRYAEIPVEQMTAVQQAGYRLIKEADDEAEHTPYPDYPLR